MNQTMTESEIKLLQDARAIDTLTLAEAREQLAVYRKYKIWAGRYYGLDRRVQTLACREWVKQDVFGHTFTGQ